MANVAYFAARRMKVGTEWREPGDPVPEAPSFPTLRELVETGDLQAYHDDPDWKTMFPVQPGFTYDPNNLIFDPDKVAKYNEHVASLGSDPAADATAYPAAPPTGPPRGVQRPLIGNRDQGSSTDSMGPTSWDVKNKGIAATMLYAADHPNEARRILADEKSGRKRQSLIVQLQELINSSKNS